MAPDPQALYRLRPKAKNGIDCFTAEELMLFLFVDECLSEPADIKHPVSVWRCENTDCNAWDIRIELRVPNGPTGKPLKPICPCCRMPLTLSYFIRTHTLEPVYRSCKRTVQPSA